MTKNSVQSWIALALLLAILVGVHFVLAAFPDAARSAAQAAVFAWWFLGIVAVAGALGVLALTGTRLHGLWDGELALFEKLGAPLLVGLIIGVAYVAGDTVTGYSHAVAARMHLASIHIAWPLSLPIYFGGAILVSILYFLVLIPTIYWVVAEKLLKGRGEAAVYWLIALPLALVEPLTQGDVGDVLHMGNAAVPNLIGDLAMNFGQVFFFRRAGFVACVAVRIGFYAVWHIIYPVLMHG